MGEIESNRVPSERILNIPSDTVFRFFFEVLSQAAKPVAHENKLRRVYDAQLRYKPSDKYVYILQLLNPGAILKESHNFQAGARLVRQS